MNTSTNWRNDKAFLAWLMEDTGASEKEVLAYETGMDTSYKAWCAGRAYQHNNAPHIPNGVFVHSTLDHEVAAGEGFWSKTYGGIFVTPGREQEAEEILKEMDPDEWDTYAPEGLVQPIPEKFRVGDLLWTGKFDANIAQFLDQCRAKGIEAWVMTGYRDPYDDF